MNVRCDICHKPVEMKPTTEGKTVKEWQGECAGCGAVFEVRRYAD
jgi:hypothetical protein